MGVEYYVIDKLNKTFYELGKGGWIELKYEPGVFQDPDYLELFILEDCFQKEFYDEQGWQKIVEHVKTRVVPDLYKFFGKTPLDKLELVNDCGDDITVCRAKGYTCVGTRYYDKNSKQYRDCMDSNNRHLSDNPMNKRWYNPDSYKDCPEWEKY